MSTAQPLYESQLRDLQLLSRGKVRDIYALGDSLMLIVASDRLSAFDVVLLDPIPDKGNVLTSLSNFWFERSEHLVANHLSGRPLEEFITDPEERRALEGRATVVKHLDPLPVEAIVRGYIIGSGWKDYQATGAVCGIALPEGLRQAEALPEPIFTPSTKAEIGEHDQNIGYEQVTGLLGKELADQVRRVSLDLYNEAARFARERGIIIADTKFEFGTDAEGRLVLIDEVLTPDSSRFWPADSYRAGISPPSFDKQFVRDYLETLDWDKRPPAPRLPGNIVAKTSQKYREARRRLTE